MQSQIINRKKHYQNRYADSTTVSTLKKLRPSRISSKRAEISDTASHKLLRVQLKQKLHRKIKRENLERGNIGKNHGLHGQRYRLSRTLHLLQYRLRLDPKAKPRDREQGTRRDRLVQWRYYVIPILPLDIFPQRLNASGKMVQVEIRASDGNEPFMR